MPTYGKVAVNFLRHDVSGTATDLAVADIAKKDGETFTGTMNAYDLIVANNLTVNGTQTILNTETLQVEDKEIDLGKVSSPSNASASGGGIKLLGGSDGDKTITWLSSNNAWNFSENIHLEDNKKLLVGTGSGKLSIYHDGTNSRIDNDTGQLHIKNSSTYSYFDTDGLYVRNAAGTESFISATNNGSVDLYFNGTKRCETTNSGINVLGQLNVNGSALSAAPTIDATANGSIAANTAVVVRSDGDVEQVAETVTLNTVLGTEFDTNNGNQARNSIAYDPDKDQWITAYANVYSTSGYPYYRVSNTSDQFGGATQILNEKCVETDLVYHDGEEAMVVFYVRNAGTPRGVARVLYSKNSGSIGTANEFFEAFNSYGWVYDPASTRIVGHVQRLQSTPYLNVLIQLSVNTDNSITDQGDITITTDRCDAGSIGIGNGFIVTAFQKEDAKLYVRAYKWNSSSNSYTASSVVQVTTYEADYSAIGYSTKDQKFVLIFIDKTSSSALRGCFLTLTESSGTPSVSVGTISNAGEPTNTQKPALYYDTGIGELVAYYIGGSGSAARAEVKRVNSTGSNFAWVSGETELGSSQNWNAGNVRAPIAFNTVDNKAMGFWHDNNYTKARTVSLGSSVTNVTASNFIGFSNENATANDATCTVHVVGNTTTQSSLTAGQKYFVQNDGSLSTSAATPSVEAGIALSATTLLIKG